MVDLAVNSKHGNSEWWRRHLQPIKHTFWLFVTRDNGNLEIFVMPDMKLVYIVTNVGNGNKILTDSIEFVQLAQQHQANDAMDTSNTSNRGGSTANASASHTQQLSTLPVEILMVGLGNHGTRPMLFIRTESELLIYRAFRYPRGKHLKIRFRKVTHEILWARSEQMVDHLQNDPHFRLMRYFGKPTFD